LMSDAHSRSTALLDLDVHFGTGALALDLEPGRGLTDAIENPGRIDGLFIERAMIRAGDKLSVLSSEAPIHQAMLSDGGAFYQLQEELRSAFECTIIDLPRQMLVQHPHLMSEIQSVVLVSELTLVGARDMIRLLSWIKSNAPQAQIVTVANRVGPSGTTEMARKDFETSIERKMDYVVPFDVKTVCQAAKLGRPVAEVGKSSKVGLELMAIAGQLISITDSDEPTVVVAGKSTSLAGRIAGFKAMLPGKKVKVEA
jgi:pilus assembly protein CpaE